MKKRIVDLGATAWAERATRVSNRGERMPPGCSRSQYQLANKLVFAKLKAALGLGSRAPSRQRRRADRARTCSSSSPSLDLPIIEVYGQSEDTGPTSFNRPGKTKYRHRRPGLSRRSR